MVHPLALLLAGLALPLRLVLLLRLAPLPELVLLQLAQGVNHHYLLVLLVHCLKHVILALGHLVIIHHLQVPILVIVQSLDLVDLPLEILELLPMAFLPP